MIKILDIAYTGYPVTNMERSRHFYEKLLGLVPQVYPLDEGKLWVEYVLPSTTLAISDVDPNWKPSGNGPSVGLEVEDMAETMRFFQDKSIPVLTQPFETPVCTIAVISDPDGNLITIHKKNEHHPDHVA